MTNPTPDDELLAILLINLSNAEKTFGPGTPPYESIRATVKEHLESMQAKGVSTNLASTRQFLKGKPGSGVSEGTSVGMFGRLPFRPKPGGS